MDTVISRHKEEGVGIWRDTVTPTVSFSVCENHTSKRCIFLADRQIAAYIHCVYRWPRIGEGRDAICIRGRAFFCYAERLKQASRSCVSQSPFPLSGARNSSLTRYVCEGHSERFKGRGSIKTSRPLRPGPTPQFMVWSKSFEQPHSRVGEIIFPSLPKLTCDRERMYSFVISTTLWRGRVRKHQDVMKLLGVKVRCM